MADSEAIFLRARHGTFSGLTEDAEHEWTGPFCFIQAADPQLGLMKAWKDGDCDGGGDEWAEEVELTKQAVEAVNQLRPRPRFMVLCGDLVHAMPDTPFREGQERDLRAALKGTDPSIPLVFVSGNHDLGNTPTPGTVEQYRSAWGDDYFSFWVGGVFCLVLNSQLFYDASACPQLKEAQETWLEEQLSRASSSTEPKPKHVLVFQHIPLYLKSPDEEDDYFNLQREVRQNLLDRFKKAGQANARYKHPIRETVGLLEETHNQNEERLCFLSSMPQKFHLSKAKQQTGKNEEQIQHSHFSLSTTGVKAVFSGHYHRNAGGCHDGLDMVVSSAIGCQLGRDAHGVRVVVVTADGVVHRYHDLEQLRAGGVEEDLRKLLQA
ncbi:putative calcineurin-like phosphoesterase domain-containing protein 1 [Scophthalmus maximus]|uniref:Serine/threonine-protein phosphatase CPPED1 n=1 Tax=Scophthalmus maximus TaxID=52904 RepID=A0A2U9CLB9_SCOMX|nr:putative calcineurin-like phosphoesterase domain-containing protein 1 [Scophthalmus maximus]